MIILISIAVLFLALTSGANDNFKGVATLFGSGTTRFRKALIWATVTTLLGSLASLFLAHELLDSFTGKNFLPVPIESIQNTTLQSFAFATALSAGVTVLIGTLTGLPISLTHAILGGLCGAGYGIFGRDLLWSELFTTLIIPLISSPIGAIIFSALAYYLLKGMRKKMGISRKTKKTKVVVNPRLLPSRSNEKREYRKLKYKKYKGKIAGIKAHNVLDGAHFLSSGTLSFARGLADTPKIVALLFLLEVFGEIELIIAISLSIALGGLLGAKKVGLLLSRKITRMSHGQGFTANFTSSILLITCSIFGIPVSTTHVTVGSIFGIGVINGKMNTKTMKRIVLAWILTLPIAFGLGIGMFFLTQLIIST